MGMDDSGQHPLRACTGPHGPFDVYIVFAAGTVPASLVRMKS